MRCNGLPTQAGRVTGAADVSGASPYTARRTVLADWRLYHQHRGRDADRHSYHVSGEYTGYLGMDADQCPGTATRSPGSRQDAGSGPAVVAASTRRDPCSHPDKRRHGYRPSCLSTGHHLRSCIIHEATCLSARMRPGRLSPQKERILPLANTSQNPIYRHTVMTGPDQSSIAHCKLRSRCGIILRKSLSDREALLDFCYKHKGEGI